MTNRIVITHGGCYDGFACAWLCHLVWPDATFIAAAAGLEPPAVDVADCDVIIADISFKRDILIEMERKAASLVVLDHHRTAQEDLEDLPFCVFDMNKSGARLTWEYLWDYSLGLGGDALDKFLAIHSLERYMTDLRDRPPWLIQYIEDRDLWRFQLPHSKEINAAIRSYAFDFQVWDELCKQQPKILIIEGAAVMRYRQLLVEQHVRHAVEIDMDGHRVFGVQCTAMDIASELGEALIKDRPFSVTWVDGIDRRIYSLRSRDGGIDVGTLAKKFGGGGHTQASGFRISIPKYYSQTPKGCIVEPFPIIQPPK